MQVTLTGNRYVDEVAKIHIEGNITPASWYQHITYTTTRGTYADRLAIDILSDIIYWYRPSEVRDELTGATKGWKQKFRGDSFNRSYERYAAYLKASFKQVKESFALLERMGLIRLEFRHISAKDSTKGAPASNVMHIIPIPDAIAKITYSVDDSVLNQPVKPRYRCKKNGNSDHITEMGHIPPYHRNGGHDVTEMGDTYTEINSGDLKIEQGTGTLTGCSRPEPGRERESAPVDEPFSWGEETAANVTMEEGQPTAAHSKPVSVQPESKSTLETQESKGRGKSFAANSTTVKNSDTVTPLQSVRVPKRTEQQPVKFTVNDAGWLQMPKSKGYGFVRWLTVRRLNYQMACAFSNIKLATDEQGRNIVQGNQIAFRWGDRLIFEDDLLGDDGELGFAHLRNQVFENNMLTQSAFNDLLERLFMDSLVWTRANGEDGSKRLKTASPAFVFFNGDSKVFQAARQGANKVRV